MAVAYIDAYRGAFGVQPICRVLTQHGMPAAASTYYAARARPASGRSMRGGQLMTEVKRGFKDSGEVYGARKVWRQLHREGIPAARSQNQEGNEPPGTRGACR